MPIRIGLRKLRLVKNLSSVSGRRGPDAEPDIEIYNDRKLAIIGEVKCSDHDIRTDIKKQLLAIKGIGNYAAATLLMLIGRYDELPMDSVFHSFVSEKYFKGKTVPEKRAQKIYKKWGRWKYLAYWYDLVENR